MSQITQKGPPRKGGDEDRMALKEALTTLGKKLSSATSLRSGHIAFRLVGAEGRDYHFVCAPGSAKLVEGEGPRAPRIEVIGDAKRVASAFSGKDLTKQFLAGSFRVRGDLRYASDLAIELSLIDRPL